MSRIPAETARDHLSQLLAVSVERDAWAAGVPLDEVVALRLLARAERREPAWPRRGLYDEPAPLAPVPCRIDILAGLALLGPVSEGAEKVELLLISGARARGLTWEQIADVLGLESRQAAEQRWKRLRGRYRDEVLPSEFPPEAADDGVIDVPPPGYLRDPGALERASR